MFLNRRKLRKEKRWADSLKLYGAPDLKDFDKEWRARGLPWPIKTQTRDDEFVKTNKIIDDLERKNDLWQSILTWIAAIFTILVGVLVYLFIH